ncbi:MAG: ABC transporter permease [Anaerolineae bacterium]|nr:ABC transporter permease [Anaerolineae bacterium]
MFTPTRRARPFTARAPFGLKLLVGLVLLFLYCPFGIILLYSFTTEETAFTFPPPGLTADWYRVALFDRPDIYPPLLLSIQVALVATFIALILGSLIAFAISRTRFFGREAITFLVILPIALPGIITGISLRSAFGLFGIDFSFWTIVIGHATFCIVVVYNNVVARLRRTAKSQTEASADLGANSLQTLRYILLPVIGTALLAGGMLAFALSFDEVIVTTFTAGQQNTLPIWIYSQLSRPRQRPVTNVVAVFVIAITFIPIFLAQRLTQDTND